MCRSCPIVLLALCLLAGCAASPTPGPQARTEQEQYALDDQLLRAAYACDTERVEVLLEQGADVDAKIGDRYAQWTEEKVWDEDGGRPIGGDDWTPLLAALNNYDADDLAQAQTAVVLIEAGADIDAADDHGATVLYDAIRQRQTTLALWLIERGAKLDTVTQWYIDADEGTPLWLASKYGLTSVVQALIQAGADVQLPSSYGTSPLREAVREGEYYSARMLLEAGADPNEKVMREIGGEEVYYTCPLIDATEIREVENKEDFIRLLLQNGATIPTGAAIDSYGAYSDAIPSELAVEQLVKGGLPVDTFNRYGTTPLHLAVQEIAFTDCLHAMLHAKKANFDVNEDDGSTALSNAVEAGNWGAVQLLLGHGAKPDAISQEMLELLLDPLEWDTDSLMILALLQHGADPNRVPWGIFGAIKTRDPILVSGFVLAGADLTHREQNESPLAYAKRLQTEQDDEPIRKIIDLLERYE